MERVGQAECFVFDKVPAGIISADIVRDVSSEEPMLSVLDFVLKPLAVVRKRRFAGDLIITLSVRDAKQRDHPPHQPPRSICCH